MGLLDDLLSGLSDDRPAGRSQPQPQAGGSGMSMVMKALLPIVLAMLANRGSSRPQANANADAGGAGGVGLDDLLGSLLGGSGGGGAGGGGLGGLLSQLQRAGFGAQADSWVGRGQNQPLPADALEQVFGRGGMEEIARRAGVSEADASRGLSQLLPEVVDHVTPEGRVPDFGKLTASVDALARRSGVR